jgi:hypothetical protein
MSMISGGKKPAIPSREITHFHVSRMLHDILEIFVGGEAREVIGYHLLSVTCQYFGSILHVHASGFVGFNKEATVARRVRHFDRGGGFVVIVNASVK